MSSLKASKISIYNDEKTTQKVFFSDARKMEIEDETVHLVITSPPYFNTKNYSEDTSGSDLGNINDFDHWLEEMDKVWKECYRVLQPGRKLFINIMNLPISEGKTFRMLNIVGRTIENCSKMGFVFKRDIIWEKTNGVKAHFGSFPYPGSILLNNMHEFILEFEKPNFKNRQKYRHLTVEQKEASKLDKEFWLSLKNTDVWRMKPHPSGLGKGRTHLAPFPEELPYRIIKAYSYISETVLDPFVGSGTTLKVAQLLERNAIGFEINENFGELIDKKMKKAKN